MLEPTEELIRIASQHQSAFVFFVDAGFIFQLQHHRHISQCHSDYEKVSAQLKQLDALGHEIALHVHPHWEDSRFENGKWNIDTRRYKLSDFSETEIENIIDKYHAALSAITGKRCTSFRAGGWCIQPFLKIKNALKKNGIYTESSVYKNGYHQFTAQRYDFRKAPDKAEWNFEDDECTEIKNGTFTEAAITPDLISPLFYFKLYFKMKSDPGQYKPIGDGSWLKDKKKIYKQFYSFTRHFACCDGYFASRLKNNLLNSEAENKNRMLVLGHPKSMAKCSFAYLDEFIGFAKEKGYSCVTLHEDFKK